MKKIKKKLFLDSETVTRLQSNEMMQIKGGFTSIGRCCHSRNRPTDCATTGASSCQGS
jgi:hypothetical protein